MSKVLIQIQKQIPVSIDTDVFIGKHRVIIDEAVICGGITDIKGRIDSKPIPQTKEVEWENGDRCIHDGSEYTFVGMTPTFSNESCIIFDSKNGIEHVCVRKLSKPESPEAKKERERIESAKRLYSKHCKAVRHPVKDLDNNAELLNAWLVIVDETGYRKESE